MTSEARIAANRRNAAKSTGPRTEAGKAAARRNALRHGLTAEQIVMFDENTEDFVAFHDELRVTLDPADAVEEMLAERIVLCAWRLRRASRTETELYAAMTRREGSWRCEHLGEAFRACDGALKTLSRYETALDRALEKAYTMLERRQAQRRGEAATASGKDRSVDVEEIAERVAEILLETEPGLDDDDPSAVGEEPGRRADWGLPARFYETNPTTEAAAQGAPDDGARKHPMRDVPFYGTNPFKPGSAPPALSEAARGPAEETEGLPK
jgi:hypothetical protein